MCESIEMSEECEENKNSFDFSFPENGSHVHVQSTSKNVAQDFSRDNEEESSGASDYPEGISGFTPPKDFRIHKLYKAKIDRKTTKKPMHKSHSATKLSKKEQRFAKSKSMVELPLSPDLNVSHQKYRHSIHTCTVTTSEISENTLLFNEEDKPAMHQSQSSPVVNKLQDVKTPSKSVQIQEPPQSSVKSSSPILKKKLSNNASHAQVGTTNNPWQKFPFQRRASVDANAGIVSRTSSSPSSSSVSLFDSLNDYRMKPRNNYKLQLLSVHVDQDDRLDYGLPNRMKFNSLSWHQHTSSVVPECPRERNEFYSHLHMTVLHLGAVPRRQADSEETKEDIHQFISLQLQAYLQSRSVKDVSDDLTMKKLDVDKTITDILDFSLGVETIHKDLFRPFSVRALYTELSGDTNDGDDIRSLETINEEDGNLEPQSADSTVKQNKEIAFYDDQFMTSAQAHAMEKVKEVLDTLDEAESLYPSLSKMGDEHPKYRSIEFVRRVEALQLWVTITETLASKLCQMSQLCGIRVDLEPGEDDVCLQSLNSSRISWAIMETEQTRTSCCEKKYRDFVDKHLKKCGLEKMIGMIKNLLVNALLMARYVCKRSRFNFYLLLLLCRYAYTGERNGNFQSSYRAHYHRGSSNEGERVPLLKDSPAKPKLMWERRISLFPLYDEESWLGVFEQMNLPSFDRQFLQLARVPLDVMHVCIRKNLNLHCQENLSILSLKAVSIHIYIYIMYSLV